MQRITVDMRMINHSGIGTYIRNLVPLIMKAHPEFNYTLLGPKKILNKYDWAHYNHVNVVNCSSKIYSLSEQIELSLKTPRDTSLFWSPHYNIPLFYHGILLVTVHDLFHLAMPQLVPGIHKRFYARTMFSQISSKANAVICISKFTKNELMRFVHCKEEKIHLISNGIDQSWRNITKEHNPYPKPFLLFVGNVKPNKNLVSLIKAFDMIKNQIPHDLVIVGKKEGFITGDAAVLNVAGVLGPRINFTGPIDNATLIQYYKHAEALIFPSIYEGFGLPPLEAMRCDCPVIVSNLASLPEVCGDAAMYCNPYSPDDIAEKIVALIHDLELRETLISKGRMRSSLFTWEESAQKTSAIIEKILN
jgi:glycosyltransferase involved in cell wall biosynthesis